MGVGQRNRGQRAGHTVLAIDFAHRRSSRLSSRFMLPCGAMSGRRSWRGDHLDWRTCALTSDRLDGSSALQTAHRCFAWAVAAVLLALLVAWAGLSAKTGAADDRV